MLTCDNRSMPSNGQPQTWKDWVLAPGLPVAIGIGAVIAFSSGALWVGIPLVVVAIVCNATVEILRERR